MNSFFHIKKLSLDSKNMLDESYQQLMQLSPTITYRKLCNLFQK